MEVSSIISSTMYVYHLVNIPYVHFHFLFCCFLFPFFFFLPKLLPHIFCGGMWLESLFLLSFPYSLLIIAGKCFERSPWESALGFLPPYTYFSVFLCHLPELKARQKLNFAIHSSFKIKFHLIIFLGHYTDTRSFKVPRELVILLLHNLIKIWNIPQRHARNKKAGQHAFHWASRQWGFQSAGLPGN